MEYIITFKNTNFAIKAEQCLLEQQLNVRVMPLPSQISAGCGICLRMEQDDIGAALRVLADRSINEVGLFSRETVDKQFFYAEICDRSILLEL